MDKRIITHFGGNSQLHFNDVPPDHDGFFQQIAQNRPTGIAKLPGYKQNF